MNRKAAKDAKEKESVIYLEEEVFSCFLGDFAAPDRGRGQAWREEKSLLFSLRSSRLCGETKLEPYGHVVNRDYSFFVLMSRNGEKREMKTFVSCVHAFTPQAKCLWKAILKGERKKFSCVHLRSLAFTPGRAAKTFLGFRLREGILRLQRRIVPTLDELIVNRKFNVSGSGVCRKAHRRAMGGD